MASPDGPRTVPVPGTSIGGYRLEEVIGEGGMGVVYRARHIALDRAAAVKVIQPALAPQAALRERFEREWRTAAGLDHPNVIPIFDAGEEGGVLYIAMRYVDGTDLAHEIASRGPLEPDRAVRIVAQVAMALDAAHAAGLVHRDVKPANVLLTKGPSGEHVFLSDFGVSKHGATPSGLTGTGQVVGSPDFAAPEQLRGEPVDARADVYALGCLLYQALTGRLPFPRDGALAVMFAHINEPPPAVTVPAPHLPPGIDDVIARALAKAPSDRFASAGQLAAAARAAIEGREVHVERAAASTDPAAPVTPAAPRRRRRRPGRGALVGVLAVAAAAAGAALAVLALAPTPEARQPGPGTTKVINVVQPTKTERVVVHTRDGDRQSPKAADPRTHPTATPRRTPRPQSRHRRTKTTDVTDHQRRVATPTPTATATPSPEATPTVEPTETPSASPQATASPEATATPQG